MREIDTAPSERQDAETHSIWHFDPRLRTTSDAAKSGQVRPRPPLLGRRFSVDARLRKPS